MVLSTVVSVQTGGAPTYPSNIMKTFRLEYSVDCTTFKEVGNNLVLNSDAIVNLRLYNHLIKQ